MPKDNNALPYKWVYRYNPTSHDGQPKYKARLMAKGFKQEQEIEFDEVFLPFLKMTILRSVLAMVSMHDLDLH